MSLGSPNIQIFHSHSKHKVHTGSIYIAQHSYKQQLHLQNFQWLFPFSQLSYTMTTLRDLKCQAKSMCNSISHQTHKPFIVPFQKPPNPIKTNPPNFEKESEFVRIVRT